MKKRVFRAVALTVLLVGILFPGGATTVSACVGICCSTGYVCCTPGSCTSPGCTCSDVDCGDCFDKCCCKQYVCPGRTGTAYCCLLEA